MKRRVIAGLVASGIVLLLNYTNDRANDHRENARECADSLGIVWSADDGVTQQLADFQQCLGRPS